MYSLLFCPTLTRNIRLFFFPNPDYAAFDGVLYIVVGRKLLFLISYFFAVQTVLGLEEGKECIVIGTIYKHMKLKPSILDEYSKEVF